MRIGIMQPYLFPYIGYFQLMNVVDQFVIYDNIEFTKKGWINRNRILVNGKDDFISLPLKKGSDFLFIKERSIAETWEKDRITMLNRIRAAYRKAPFFETAYLLIETVLTFENYNLFHFIHNSLELVNKHLDITTPIIVSSSVPIDHKLRSQEKVIAICKQLKGTTYINPAGGVDLYSSARFKENDIDLRFLKTGNISYEQFDNEFIPFLSIIDVLMFNSKSDVKNYLQNSYILTEN